MPQKNNAILVFLLKIPKVYQSAKCQYFHWSLHPLFYSEWLMTLYGLVILNLHNEGQVYHKEKAPCEVS